MKFKQICFVILSSVNFILTVYTVGKLIFFLSNGTSEKAIFWIQQTQINSINDQIIRPLTFNLFLILLFMGQHSLMKNQIVKDLFIKLNFTVIERTIYTITTSLALLILIDNWKIIYGYPLWSLNATDGVLWWAFSFTHLIGWSFIYGGAILMDIPELIGIKQVYYNIMDWMDPLVYKSKSLQKLYKNMRHPSFIGFLLIFWISPLMTLDRLLLAVMLSSYMYYSWKTCPLDYEYQQDQFIRKKYSLQ